MQATEEKIKVNRRAAIQLFVDVGIPTATDWEDDKLRGYIQNIEQIAKDPDLVDGLSDEQQELLGTLVGIAEKKAAEDIEFVGSKDGKKERQLEVPEGMKESDTDVEDDEEATARKDAEEEASADVEEDTSEDGESNNKHSKKKVVKHKKPGRPAKVKKEPKSSSSHGRKHPVRSGTVIEREYKGKTYRVVASGDAFEYKGKEYTSLTVLAKLITGAESISGPRFFGLVEVGKNK